MLQTQRDKPIATIALETGFSSPVQFYRAFGLTEGMTPGEYQEVADLDETRAESARDRLYDR